MQHSPRRLRRTSAIGMLPVAVLTLAALAFAGLPTASAATPANAGDDITSGLIARYKLDETQGSVAVNSAPAGGIGNGVVEGPAGWSGAQGFAFTGGARGSGNAISLPRDLNAGLTSISIDFDVFVASDQANYYMIYAIGNRGADGAGERYLFSSGDSFHTVITPARQSQEINIQPTSGATLARGLWKHITYVQSGTTGILYEDGIERARNTAVTTTPAALGSTAFNFLGRSTYDVDESFKGRLRDFRIYDRGLTAAEAATLSVDVQREAVKTDEAAVDLGALAAVTDSLTLPRTGPNQTTMTWTTSNADIVSAQGTITRGAPGTAPAKATLTMTTQRGSERSSRDFAITVPPRNDQADADAAATSLVLTHIDDVRENLTLPISAGAATVSWASSDPSVIATDGRVRRPDSSQSSKVVTLTATVRAGTATSVRRIAATVRPSPVIEETKGYLFPYFTGEANAQDEQVRYAVSNGNDALDWVTVNDNRPVLSSTLGEKGLRDPFVIRSHEGDRFYLLATDLNAFGTGLEQSQVFGSRAIEVWESTDLVTWSNQRHVVVSAPEAGNTWAPEAYYDEAQGSYVVYWASNLYPSGDPAVARDPYTNYNRMMYSTTRDFVTFTTPKVWIDDRQPGAGNGTIDSTMFEEDGWFYRFTVTEGSNIPRVDRTRDIYATLAPGHNPWLGAGIGSAWEPRQSAVGFGQAYIGTSGRAITFDEGEGTTVFKPNKGDINGDGGVYAFIDQAPYYGGDGYVPFRASSLAAGDWTIVQKRNLPDSARHGTVLPISVTEYQAILTAYQPDRLITSDDVRVTTLPGIAPALPTAVQAVQARGTAQERALGLVAVRWDDIDTAGLQRGKTVTVNGVIEGHGFVTARVAVLDVSASVTARCVAGKVTLVVAVNNAEPARIEAEVTTPYGSKTSASTAAGASNSYAFSSRQSQVAAGEVRVSVTTPGTISKTPQVSVPYSMKRCS